MLIPKDWTQIYCNKVWPTLLWYISSLHKAANWQKIVKGTMNEDKALLFAIDTSVMNKSYFICFGS